MKKKLFAIAAIIVCVSLIAAGTLAYFTDEVTVHNVITSSGVDITVEEWQDVDGEWEPYPDEPMHVMPGVDVSKIVTVANEQAQAWIRARFDIEMFDAQDEKMDLTAAEIAAIIEIEINEEYWTAGEDGWYYYNTSVGTGEVTEPLFETVHFSGPNMTNEYQNCTVDILVSAQGVQAANNGATVQEAAGWPAA